MLSSKVCLHLYVIAEPLYHTPEINKTLYINYVGIKI